MNLPPILSGSSQPTELQAPAQTKAKDKLTLAGILLSVVTIAATVAGGIFCVFWLFPRMLPGGRYPIWLLAVPIVGCGCVVAFGGSWLCKLLGIQLTIPIDEKSGAGTRTV